jgi:hypothetical protein
VEGSCRARIIVRVELRKRAQLKTHDLMRYASNPLTPPLCPPMKMSQRRGGTDALALLWSWPPRRGYGFITFIVHLISLVIQLRSIKFSTYVSQPNPLPPTNVHGPFTS